MSDRIYAVHEDGKVRLVQAKSAAAALAHVTSPRFSVEVASARKVADAMQAGAKVETAAEPAK